MSSPELESNMRFEVARRANILIASRQFAAGTDAHRAAMEQLLRLLVENPGSVDELFRQQNGTLQKDGMVQKGGGVCGKKPL